jgi:hypothetical protein
MALWPKYPFIAKGMTSKGYKNALISPLMQNKLPSFFQTLLILLGILPNDMGTEELGLPSFRKLLPHLQQTKII